MIIRGGTKLTMQRWKIRRYTEHLREFRAKWKKTKHQSRYGSTKGEIEDRWDVLVKGGKPNIKGRS